MPRLLVVESRKAFPLHVPGAEVITAHEYLTNRRFRDMKRATVFNLCRSHQYQTAGYYVSLLAAARNHKPLPSLGTMINLRHSAVVRIASDDLDELIQKSLAGLKSDTFELSIYFGRNTASRHDKLCQALFDHFPAPLLRATFQKGSRWRLTDLRIISSSNIPDTHHFFVEERARTYFQRAKTKDTETLRFDLAILVDSQEKDAPSCEKALNKFVKAGRQVGIRAFLVGREEYARIAEYDALFIRATTGVNHHTYRFASRAQKEGLVVIDDPESILRCCNKVYQAEVFEKYDIPCPRTQVVHEGNRHEIGSLLGYPVVLKRPDSSFSQGVVKASTPEELENHLDTFLTDSELVVAQSFAKSDFDWRVGILGGKALFVCRYFMAKGHWQIQQNQDGKKTSHGKHETLAVSDAPPAVVELALKAANCIGHGLYGVDIKETEEGRLLVMEVNDNPNLDAGIEDAVLKDELYLTVMRHFYDRCEERGRR